MWIVYVHARLNISWLVLIFIIHMQKLHQQEISLWKHGVHWSTIILQYMHLYKLLTLYMAFQIHCPVSTFMTNYFHTHSLLVSKVYIFIIVLNKQIINHMLRVVIGCIPLYIDNPFVQSSNILNRFHTLLKVLCFVKIFIVIGFCIGCVERVPNCYEMYSKAALLLYIRILYLAK